MALAVKGPWWVRPGLEIRDERLTIAGRDAEGLARENGTPVYVYDLTRFAENARVLQEALASTGLPHIVRFALKANREPEVLAVLRDLGEPGSTSAVGIDACSPGEVVHAIANGWQPTEISFTGTNVSDRDFRTILGARNEGSAVHINLDAVSQVERFGRLAPGSTIGLRVDPRAGAGYHAGLRYSGERPTKFGIGPERLEDAIAAARRYDLLIDTVHFHAGSGWLSDGLVAFERALAHSVEMARVLIDSGAPIREVNVGGGLGRPARDDEAVVDLDDRHGRTTR
jgi:diaminopimelate decarboxylase